MTKPDAPSTSEDTSAADEPTAMWDASALKDLGLEEAAKQHEERPVAKPLAAPVTTPVARARPKTVPKKAKGASDPGMSIPVLVALSVGVGIAVYFLVGYLLG